MVLFQPRSHLRVTRSLSTNHGFRTGQDREPSQEETFGYTFLTPKAPNKDVLERPLGLKACRAWIGGRRWTRDPKKLRKEEVGLQGKRCILFLKGLRQPMLLPTEGTGKRKPKEEDGGGRQKKEQDGGPFLPQKPGRETRGK